MFAVLLVAFLLVIPVSVMWQGFVSKLLWGWFVVPLFHLPQLTITQAIGLTVVIHALCPTLSVETKADDSTLDLTPFARPLVLLIMGWIVHLFM